MVSVFAKLFSFSRIRDFIFVVDLVALPLGVVAIWQTSVAIQLQVDSNEEQRVAAAWAQVANRATGNSGKGEALNLLFEKREDLSGLLIDCKSMGGEYVSDPVLRCKGAPFLEGLRLIGTFEPLPFQMERFPEVLPEQADFDRCEPERLNIEGSDFSGSYFRNSVIYCAMMINVSASTTVSVDTTIASSWLYNFDISDSYGLRLVGNSIDGMIAERSTLLDVKFSGTNATGINFTDARFSRVDFTGLEGFDWNVSGANFCYARNSDDPMSEEECSPTLPDEVLKGMWAWSDQPPKAVGPLAEQLKKIKTCPSEYRTPTFGREYQNIGFVYDRGYKPPVQCQEPTDTSLDN